MSRTHRHLHRRSHGYTMTEILVVIGIIVLMLAIGVPAFNLIRGGRSLDAAENQIAAMLGRARTNAIGLQKVHGVLFILDMKGDAPANDPANDQVLLAEVVEAPYPAGGTRDLYLDLTDTEFVPLPVGVGVQTLNESSAAVSDRYLGFHIDATASNGNLFRSGTYAYGGVILFNGRGQVVNRTYGFLTSTPPPSGQGNNIFTNMSTQLFMFSDPFINPGAPTSIGAGANPPSSAFGFSLFDRQQFLGNGNDRDEQLDNANQDAATEEGWIDSNGLPLMINRFNGSLVRGV